MIDYYYHPNGSVSVEQYTESINGKILLHNEDGPSIISFDQDGNIAIKAYYFNGVRHRLDGPAYLKYHKNGRVILKSYHLYGENINVKTQKQFLKYVRLMAFK